MPLLNNVTDNRNYASAVSFSGPTFCCKRLSLILDQAVQVAVSGLSFTLWDETKMFEPRIEHTGHSGDGFCQIAGLQFKPCFQLPLKSVLKGTYSCHVRCFDAQSGADHVENDWKDERQPHMQLPTHYFGGLGQRLQHWNQLFQHLLL